MVCMAQALLAQPKVLVVDELSLGLAPLVVAAGRMWCRPKCRDGVGVLLIEQFTTLGAVAGRARLRAAARPRGLGGHVVESARAAGDSARLLPRLRGAAVASLRRHASALFAGQALPGTRGDVVVPLEQAGEVRATFETPRETDLGGRAVLVAFLVQRRMAALQALRPDLSLEAGSVVLEDAMQIALRAVQRVGDALRC